MPVSPARAAAFEILLRVEREQSYASELLHSVRFAALSTADHGLATELVMGVLRWRSLLDERLAKTSSQKLDRLDLEVLIALRLGVYQLHFLSRIPARAAIFESVELVKSARKRSAAPFVNAVLRKVVAPASEISSEEIRNADGPTKLAESAAHPEWVIARWVERYGLAAVRQICFHDQSVPETAIHAHDGHALEELANAGVQLSPGLLISNARRVVSGEVTKTKAFREGRISVQDEASQLVAVLLGQGEKILDCCAAPGSKASLVAQRNPKAIVIAADLHPHRARLLRDLVRRPNVRVVTADACHLPFRGGFDRVLADVPCSGTGTLARNPEIKWRVKPSDLVDLQSRQIEILRSALAQLGVGGRLVYSTCSLECEENETVVETVLKDEPAFKVVDCRAELETLQRSGELAWKDLHSLLAGPYLRTLPGVHPCDGFFAAVIERS